MNTTFPPNKDWISTGVLPRGGTMIIAGESKIGKSFVCLSAARALAFGEYFLQHPKMPVREAAVTLYVENEIRPQGVQERLLRAVGDVDERYLRSNLYVLSGAKGLDLSTSKGWVTLKEHVDYVQPNVLILDPISRFIGGAQEDKSYEIGPILDRLEGMLRDHRARDMALIFSHHTKKPWHDENYDPLDPHEMRGSSRFYANPDSIFTLARLPNTLGVNSESHKTWQLEGRLELRQAEGFEKDLVFTFNHDNDLLVKYSKSKTGPDGPPKLSKDIEKKTQPPRQLKLADA